MVGFIGVNQRPTSSVNPDEIARKMRLDYLYSQKDLNQKALDGVQTLFEHFQRREFDLDAFMNDALNLIFFIIRGKSHESFSFFIRSEIHLVRTVFKVFLVGENSLLSIFELLEETPL